MRLNVCGSKHMKNLLPKSPIWLCAVPNIEFGLVAEKEPSRSPTCVLVVGLAVLAVCATCAALLAFPTTWTKALLGFLIGFPMIYAMNILRICLLLVAGRYMGESFDLIHVYFWQVTMIAMVASTWLFWVVWVVRRDYGPTDTAGGRGS